VGTRILSAQSINVNLVSSLKGMKLIRKSLIATFAGTLAVLIANNPVDASDNPESTNSKEGNQGLAQNSAKSRAAVAEKVSIDGQGVGLLGCDPVAYFKQKKPVKGDAAIKSVYKGATYLFASVENKAEFDKNPRNYVPQYGGFCAYGVANAVLVDPSENSFAVYRGKLYVCGNDDALRSFKSDIESNIEKANKNWEQLAKP
jgi:YHS domain-containing protein